MDKVDLEERLAQAAPAFSRAAPLIVGVFSILTLVLAGNLYVSPPTFQTDLNDFSPETDASEAHDRIHANYFPGHPELDDPEFYIRTTSKAGVEKVLTAIISGMADEFDSASL